MSKISATSPGPTRRSGGLNRVPRPEETVGRWRVLTVRRYEAVDQTRTSELVKKVDDILAPRLSKLPGFSGYHLIDAGNGVITSIGFFETAAQADESSRVASNWVREEKLEWALSNAPKITSGEVVAHAARRSSPRLQSPSRATDRRGPAFRALAVSAAALPCAAVAAATTRSRWIALQGAANVRDLGGLPLRGGGATASGVLLRADNLQGLTARDVRRLVGDLGVRVVVDLRSEVEVELEGPGPLVGEERVEIRHRSLLPEVGAGRTSRSTGPCPGRAVVSTTIPTSPSSSRPT